MVLVYVSSSLSHDIRNIGDTLIVSVTYQNTSNVEISSFFDIVFKTTYPPFTVWNVNQGKMVTFNPNETKTITWELIIPSTPTIDKFPRCGLKLFIIKDSSETETNNFLRIGNVARCYLRQILINGIEVYPTNNPIPNHKAGEQFTIQIYPQNVGAGGGNIKYEIINADTFEVIGTGGKWIDWGSWWSASPIHTFIMPNKNFNFFIRGSHEE